DTANFERELNNLPQGQPWESFLYRLLVDRNVACPPSDPGPGNGAFSSSSCILCRDCHAPTSPSSLAVITTIAGLASVVVLDVDEWARRRRGVSLPYDCPRGSWEACPRL